MHSPALRTATAPRPKKASKTATLRPAVTCGQGHSQPMVTWREGTERINTSHSRLLLQLPTYASLWHSPARSQQARKAVDTIPTSQPPQAESRSKSEPKGKGKAPRQDVYVQSHAAPCTKVSWQGLERGVEWTST
jgi:hypothetical protein